MDEAMKRKRRSISEFVRDARLLHMEERDWRQLLHYGEQTARARGIGPEDVAPLVDEYRAEASSHRA